MNRLENAQKQLAESLSALESAVEQAQNSPAHTVTSNGVSKVHVESADKQPQSASAIDMSKLSQEFTAIEADLEKAIQMIANITALGLSTGQDHDGF